MKSLAIFGSRDVDLDEARAVIFSAVAETDAGTRIVSGGARGVDTEAARAARFYRRELLEHRTDYETYGDRAPFVRNRWIEKDADRGFCVHNGESRGSLHTRTLFHTHHKPVVTVIVSKSRKEDLVCVERKGL